MLRSIASEVWLTLSSPVRLKQLLTRERTTPISQRRMLAGALLLVGCVQYLAGEAIAASAWPNGGYSYLRNYVSDLGAAAATGNHLSPLAAAFNAGILLSEVTMLAGLALLAPLIGAPVWRRTVVILATLHGLGSILVALVHSTPGAGAGTPRLHLIGAYLAIGAGNLALCAIGAGALRQRAPAWFVLPVLLGATGLAGAATLLSIKSHYPGLFERMAVDSITLGEASIGILIAIGLLARATQTVSRPPLVQP